MLENYPIYQLNTETQTFTICLVFSSIKIQIAGKSKTMKAAVMKLSMNVK